MVEGAGFEPAKAKPSDLQSDPFDRSGIPPITSVHYPAYRPICQDREQKIYLWPVNKVKWSVNIQ